MITAEQDAERAQMAKYRREWKDNFKRKDLSTLIQEHDWFYEMVGKYSHRLDEDEKILEVLHDAIESWENKLIESGKSDCPIAFFRPSWEQCQILNAWSPIFEPDECAEGYRGVCNFTANRSGKTTAQVINTLLWILPNDPDWIMFNPYTDHLGREVRVLIRPDWEEWKRTGRMIYDKTQPPKGKCEVWQGVPNDDSWHDKLAKEYKKWLPMRMLGLRGKDVLWNVAEKWFETKWGSQVRGKSYNTDVLAWSGKACFLLNLDEGLDRIIYDEAIIRIQAGGYMNWAYTPAEPRNIGQRTKLAHDVYKGKPEVQPPGRVKIFTKFKMEDVPEWILPAEKKRDDMARLSRAGAEGHVRMHGGFYESSPRVYSNWDEERHVLPWGSNEIANAIIGKGDPELVKIFLHANIVRGFDEGTAVPSACVWTAILRSGVYVFFREWEQAGISITDRCKAIVELSGNRRERVDTMARNAITEFEMNIARQFAPELLKDREREEHTGESVSRYREIFVREQIRKTSADSKLFKKDPLAPFDNWANNYNRAGLRIERALNTGPAARSDLVNDFLLPDHTRKHVNPSQCKDGQYHGHRIYISRDCVILRERFENYLFQQIRTGARTGEFTGRPEEGDDHALDSAGYTVISRMKWVDPQQYFRPERSDVEAIKAR